MTMYEELINPENQKAIRARLIEVNKKSGKNIQELAAAMGLSPTTVRKFLVNEEKVVYSVISKILGWVEREESKDAQH